jgi:tetratricopeptide (TPR) repeat protein
MNKQLFKAFAVISILIAFQITNVIAQTSPEIERLTAEIAKNPTFDSLYAQRGLLYTWNGKFYDVTSKSINGAIDENRVKALADADSALKINPNNYKAYYIRGLVDSSKTNFEKAAKLKSESNLIGYVFKADFSLGNAVYPSDLVKTAPKAIVVKGDERTKTLFDSLLLAKEFSKKNKKANVIIFDKQTKKYSLYELIIGENSPVAVQLAETPFRKALNNKPIFPMTYEAVKISADYSLQLLTPEKELKPYLNLSEVADVVDAEGLSLIKKSNIPLIVGMKGIRYLFDSELQQSNFDEALKIYQWLDKLNANSNDLDVVKINRKTNLSKMFAATDKLKPFVETEMVKWTYTEEEKTAVRGTTTQSSPNNSQTANPTTTTTFNAAETATLLRETLTGKFGYMNNKPLIYMLKNKKSNEILRYQIEFINDGGKLAFKWKELSKNEQSEKLVITDTALASASKYVNFFSTKTSISPDKEIAFILSQTLYKDLKAKNEISLDLGNGAQKMSYNYNLTASIMVYTNKKLKLLYFQSDDSKSKLEILDDLICPLIVGFETPEYILSLVR